VKRSEEKKLDRELFLWLKETRKKCERCGSVKFLQPSHGFSRVYRNVRWSAVNVRLLCAKCHWWWKKNPPAAGEWFIRLIGPQPWDNLKVCREQDPKPKTMEEGRKGWKCS
jgi:hypothetical protein